MSSNESSVDSRPDTTTVDDRVTGIVIRSEAQHHWVDIAGTVVRCTLRGRLKREQQRISRLVCAGDRVRVTVLPDGTGSIEEIAERTSLLSRPGFRGIEHLMAANVDRLVIVQATRQPKFELHLVERFVALASVGGMAAAVVINKADLADPDELASWRRELEPSGLPVIVVSAVSGQGLTELRALLAGRVSVLAGRSGVGKSSLINALYPGFAIRTGAVGASTEKGKHTTTTASLYAIPDGGYLVDTPGIKELSLFDDGEGLDSAFSDIVALAADCRFSDCRHDKEPGCAVRAAVDAGDLDPERLKSYLRLNRRRPRP